ncbi:hypothetical protein OC861_006866 [Tilletia horrida]|nr:hypothetical protein OC861_006866 [Tilletia horrida]
MSTNTARFTCPIEGCNYDKIVTRDAATAHWRRHGQTIATFPLQSQQGKRPGDENSLLWKTILSHWNSLPANHPQLPSGAAILHFLSAKKTPIHLGLTSDIHQTFLIEPTKPHLNNDVLHTPMTTYNEVAPRSTIISSATGLLNPDLTRGHFFDSLVEMASSPQTISHPDHLCAILNLQASETGLLSCLVRLPDSDKAIGMPKTTVPEFSCAYTPRGHITDIHIDSVYEATITTTLFGRKLLLQWPASDFNLRLLAPFHWRGNSWRLHSLYPQLEGLKLTLCDHGTVEYLPPGAFHAVIALDNSAMMAYGIAHPNMLSDVARIAKWELAHAKVLTAISDYESGVHSILESHTNDIDIWIKLSNKALMRPFKDRIDELKATLEAARTELISN